MPAPTLRPCPSCGTAVFHVLLIDRLVLVDPRELEAPRLTCPRCAGRPRREPCERCGGVGKVGEPLPKLAIGMDEDGHARVYRGFFRRRGEALYRPHACSAQQVA